MQGVADMDVLLEWVNEVRKAHEAHGGVCDTFADLADGRVLLGVMHDFSPSCFPDLESIHLTKLLEGLVAHFRARPDRGSEGGRLAQQLLEGCVRGAGCPEIGRLVQLIVWATLDPEHHEYIAVCDALRQRNPSFENALKDIIVRFNPEPLLKSADSDMDLNSHPSGSIGAADTSEDFLNPAVDIQTRFALLTQAYHKVMQEREQEREQWHKDTQERDQEREQWQTRLRAAEDAQRETRETLDAAHEDQHKAQEDQRAVLERRLEDQTQRHEKTLRKRNEEIADLREKLDSNEQQAEQAERLELQLADARKKIEELREKQKESGELTARLERQQEGPDLVALNHQRGKLEKMQSHLEAAVEEREEEQRQVQMLQFELGDERNAREEAADEASRYRRELVELASASGSGQAARAATSSAAAAAVARQTPRVGMSGEVFSEPPAGSSEIQRLYQQWLDEKDRLLLEEKERVKTAEADLQTQRTESLKIAEKRASEEARAAALEERLRSEAAQLKEFRDLHGTPGPTPRGGFGAVAAGAAASAADGAAAAELQGQLAQRERELQVVLHRGQIDAHHLAVQEGLMASSFHAVGLRYQKLLAQRDQLLQRVRDLEQRPGIGSA